MLKLILLLWGTSALFTAPLQPSCWNIPHLSRGVHHSASSINHLLSAGNCSCPCGLWGSQGRGTPTMPGGDQQEIKSTRMLPPPWGTPAMAASFPRGVITTLGTRVGHTASPAMDQQHLTYFNVLCLPFDKKLLIKKLLCCSVFIPFLGIILLLLWVVSWEGSVQS